MSQCKFTVSLIPLQVMNKIKSERFATGSSQGRIFGFDWGAADSFAGSVKRVLNSYITSS